MQRASLRKLALTRPGVGPFRFLRDNPPWVCHVKAMRQPELVIRNAKLVDGTGAPSSDGDVSISDGKILSVGGAAPVGREEIEAAGLVLAPGFIDIHTHFDPQLCWDGLATPSLEHGVTTVVTGNCSLSLAPVRPGKFAKIVEMFEVIEDIKKRTFDAAVPFSWESFPEYLDHIRPDLGVNVGALVGHSALRYYVMGEESQKRSATPACPVPTSMRTKA